MLTPSVNSSDRSLGPDDAPVTLVEFGDYQCPYCARANGIVHDLIGRFGDELRYVFRNFPLPMHQFALPAALVAEAAQGDHFWSLHDRLYQHQDALDPDHLLHFAEQSGLSGEEVLAALNGATADKIRSDVESGEASGIQGTPTFYINGRRHDGDWSLEGLTEAVKEALSVAAD